MDLFTRKSSSLTERSDLIAGGVAVALYVTTLVLLVLFVTLDTGEEYTQIEPSTGVLISFGNSSPGEGKEVTREQTRKKNIPKPEEVIKPQSVEDDRAKDAVVEASQKPETVDKPIIKPEPEQVQVNKGALYKRPTGSRVSDTEELKTHGDTKERAGKSGSPDGETTNPGDGGTGTNFSLDGRSLIGDLVKPDYNEDVAGKIVMEIQVNRQGKVTNATYKPRESTISSSAVIEAVRKAAMQTQFNADDEASFVQVGTITYILKIE